MVNVVIFKNINYLRKTKGLTLQHLDDYLGFIKGIF